MFCIALAVASHIIDHHATSPGRTTVSSLTEAFIDGGEPVRFFCAKEQGRGSTGEWTMREDQNELLQRHEVVRQ